MISTGATLASRSAARVLPDAVGPQMTGITRRSLPAKAPLELRPGELHDGGAAVDVVRGELRGTERDEQGAHLARRQLVARLDGRLACNGGGESLVARVRARVTVAGEGGERLAQATLGVEARM